MDGDYDISHAFAFQEKFPADDANAQKRRAATRPFVPPYFFAAFLAAFAAFFAGALTAFFAAFLAVAMFAPWKHPELESAGVQPEDASFRWLNFVATNMHLRVVTKFFLARDSSLAQNSVTNILNDYKGLQSTAIFPGRLRDAVPHPFRLAGGTRGECRRPGGSASQSKLPGGGRVEECIRPDSSLQAHVFAIAPSQKSGTSFASGAFGDIDAQSAARSSVSSAP